MPRVNGVKHTVLARRALREARQVPIIEKVAFIGPGDSPEREELGRCYPKTRVQLVDGMTPYVAGETATHEFTHNRADIIGRSEQLTERAARLAHEGMTRRQLTELHRRIPPDTQ